MSDWEKNLEVRTKDDAHFKGHVERMGKVCPIHAECMTVLIVWDAGSADWMHTIYLEALDLDGTVKTDEVDLPDIPPGVSQKDMFWLEAGTRDESPETDSTDEVDLPQQVRCNCESMACENIHHMGGCPTQVDANCPKMVYAGKVCVPCGRRIQDNGGESYLTWPNQTETDSTDSTDVVGEALGSDDPLMKLKARLQDTALEIYQKARSVPRRPNWELLRIVESLPFMVIGNFAYVLGYDGDMYAAPYVPDMKAKSGMSVDWYAMVSITEIVHDRGFPTSRLGNVLSDIANITDIMRRHGAQVETDKVVRPTTLD